MTTPTHTNSLTQGESGELSMTVGQVAAATGVHDVAIYDEISAGRLLARNLGAGLVVLRTDYVHWLHSLPLAGGPS